MMATPLTDALIEADCKAFPADALLPALARRLEESHARLLHVAEISAALIQGYRVSGMEPTFRQWLYLADMADAAIADAKEIK